MLGRVTPARWSILILLAVAPSCTPGSGREAAESAGSPQDSGRPPGILGSDANDLAEAYVKLALAVGRHDPMYVDAYYGPKEWVDAAGIGEPAPLGELLARARSLLTRVRHLGPSDRRDFLEKQLVALEGFVRIRSGERMSLVEEAKVLFDVEPSAHGVEEFEAARGRLEALLPGGGDLAERVDAFRDRFNVPPGPLDPLIRAMLSETREKTAALVKLPEGDAIALRLVQGKPWAAYNWYKGTFRSLIEVNTDLPQEMGHLFHTLAHEGYPGHHTYNALLEDRLVRGRGWSEFTIYPLYSPQSLIAEGTAEVALDVILDRDAQAAFLRDRLAPVAGLEGQDFDRYRQVREIMEPLAFAKPEAAKLLLDAGRSEDEVRRFLVRYSLVDAEHAQKSIEFMKKYRSYVFTYPVGEELVRAVVGEGPDRAARYFDLLQRPVTPSMLAAGVAPSRP